MFVQKLLKRACKVYEFLAYNGYLQCYGLW